MDKHDDGSYELFTVCPNCGNANDAHDPVSAEGEPDEGALLICLYCSYPSVITQVSDMGALVRDPTRKEWASIVSDEQVLREFVALMLSRKKTA